MILLIWESKSKKQNEQDSSGLTDTEKRQVVMTGEGVAFTL